MLLDVCKNCAKRKRREPLATLKPLTALRLNWRFYPNLSSRSSPLHDKSVCPVSQHALSNLVKRIVLDVARNDHRVGVSHVGYVHAFLLELRQRIQYRDHLSLESGEARALLRRTRVLLRRHGGVRVVDEIDDDILDLALELPEYVHESLGGCRCVLSF